MRPLQTPASPACPTCAPYSNYVTSNDERSVCTDKGKSFLKRQKITTTRCHQPISRLALVTCNNDTSHTDAVVEFMRRWPHHSRVTIRRRRHRQATADVSRRRIRRTTADDISAADDVVLMTTARWSNRVVPHSTRPKEARVPQICRSVFVRPVICRRMVHALSVGRRRRRVDYVTL
jgi:hypothetical protein